MPPTITIAAGAELRICDLVRFSGTSLVPGNGLIDWHWRDGKNPDGTLFRFDRPLTRSWCSVAPSIIRGQNVATKLETRTA